MSRLRNCFLCFIRRFWNQVLTCVSLNPSAAANSTRSGVDKYLFSLNTKDVFNESAFSDWKLSAEFVFWKKKSCKKFYLWFSKRFSNPVNCGSLNTVRAFLRRQCLNAFTFIPSPRAISAEHPLPGKKLAPPNKPAA